MLREVAFVALFLAGGSYSAQPQQPLTSQLGTISPEFSRFVEHLRVEENVAGIALGIVREGRTKYGTWGIKSEDEEPVTPETLFGIASCSKTFASAALGILMDDFTHGRNVTSLPPLVPKFDWHTRIVDLLPDEWKLADKWTHHRANIKDILGHVSGVSSHDHTYLPTDSPADVIRRMRYLRPTYELRQEWSYSNQFFMLISEVIKRYSGMKYQDFVRERILIPANMTSTTFSESTAAKTGQLSQGWNRDGRLMPYWFPDNMTDLVAAPMGIISNVVDMSKWLQVLLNGGRDPISNQVIIPEDVLEQVTTANTVMFKRPMDAGFSITGYGMGWATHSFYGHEVHLQFGAVPGVTSLVAFLPREQIGVVVLTNASAKDKVTNAIVYRAIAEILRIDRERPVLVATSPLLNSPYKPISRHPFDTNLSSDLDWYTSTFVNPAYNTITLCTPTSTTGDCPDVLRAFHRVDVVSPYKTHSNLYASYVGTWSSHLRLTRLPDADEEHVFLAQFPYLFPYGYGKNTSGFEMMEPGLSEAIMKFVFEESGEKDSEKRVVGIGMYRMANDRNVRQRLGGSIEETADVWWIRA